VSASTTSRTPVVELLMLTVLAAVMFPIGSSRSEYEPNVPVIGASALTQPDEVFACDPDRRTARTIDIQNNPIARLA
jgi:hypothetical protein